MVATIKIPHFYTGKILKNLIAQLYRVGWLRTWPFKAPRKIKECITLVSVGLGWLIATIGEQIRLWSAGGSDNVSNAQ
jgi:hypothetical protein